MKHWAGLIVAAALAACQTAAAPAPAPYRVVDFTDEFDALYLRTEGQTPDMRVAAFRAEIAPLFPEFYGRERFAHRTDDQYNARIARTFERYPTLRDRFLARAAAFESLLAPAYNSFARAFPDVGDVGDIYILHSLGEMDGGTRSFGDRVYLIFGIDVMTNAHAFEDETPFFHHELFHIYHQRRFAECAEVWCSLWTEGLAVHVAATLNPGATPSQLLMDVPEPIPGPVDANLHEAVCAVRARLDSRDDADMGALFSFRRLNERLPPRFGYYVGYLAARELGRTHTLQQLADMNHAQVRPALEAALARLATCD